MAYKDLLFGSSGAQKKRTPAEDPDEEETMTYQERRPIQYLNEQKGAFESVFSRGINTEASAFERTAVFHTKNEGLTEDS